MELSDGTGILVECAGFTASEADQLRRAMATIKFTGGVSHFKNKLVGGMVERGYTAALSWRHWGGAVGFDSCMAGATRSIASARWCGRCCGAY